MVFISVVGDSFYGFGEEKNSVCYLLQPFRNVVILDLKYDPVFYQGEP